jgi:hypothetical protein
MFGGLTNTVKKSEAAVIVQEALEQVSPAGPLRSDAAEAATQLVATVWKQNPGLFEGRDGRRPHKVSVAAAALANGLKMLAGSDREPFILLALGLVLMGVAANATRYALTETDRAMLLIAENAYEAVAARRTPVQDAMLNSLGL